jgi:hypothetical protein
MKKTEGEMRQKSTEDANLDHRYGKIGISAVAAAVRYKSDAKNPAYAPVAWRFSDRDNEAA